MLSMYRAAWAAARPLIKLWLGWRVLLGKEDPQRLGERYGHASLPRPDGTLCWIHAASVGEARSVEPLIARLVRRPATSVLITTVTRTSQRALENALPERTFHQFSPLDRAPAVERFLSHWQPDIAIRVESEIWPETLSALSVRGIPRAIVQARLSAGTARRWRLLGSALSRLLAGFDPIVAQTFGDKDRLVSLGVECVQGPFNLKADAKAPGAANREEVEDLRKVLGSRPCWLAASTHPGEEETAFEAHQQVTKRIPGLLTIVIPRHPNRGHKIGALAHKRGLRTRMRTRDSNPGDADVFIVDTLGETGLFYAALDISFVGGTLTPRGGHNLLEPAKLGCAIIRGPDVANIRDIAKALFEAGASREINGAETLSLALFDLLKNPDKVQKMTEAATMVVEKSLGTTERVAELLEPIFRKATDHHART